MTRRAAWATLLVAAVAVAALGIVGLGVEDELRPSSIAIPGSPSAEASELLESGFGESAPFAILLRGPAGALDVQGPALVRALRAGNRGATVSPWDRGDLSLLRPGPRRGLVLVDFHTGSDEAIREAVPDLDRVIEETVHSPVLASQSGVATLSRALQDEAVDSTRTAELLAIPLLLVVLLLVFRSPVAALIPLAFGAATVVATRGVLAIASSWLSIDGFALTVASMMGLALGVDYALLLVSRFREELREGAAPAAAASRTRRTAGRTAAFAGSTLVVAMLLILWVMPGSLFLSLAGTATMVTIVSVAIAVFLAPPLLFLLGANVDRWRIGGRADGGRLMSVVSAVLRRPAQTAAVTGAVLVLLALPALWLKTGPPGTSQLSSSNGARQDAEAIADAIGPGWDAPFVLVAASERGPITAARRLREIRATQRQISRDPGVEAVIGPARVERRGAQLRQKGEDLLAGRGEAGPRHLTRLGSRLERAAGGVGQLRGGIAQAAAGAGLLASGSGRAEEGAAQISGGLADAASGATRAVDALERLDGGSARIAAGQSRAALASRALKDELTALMPILRQGGLARARGLRGELSAAAASDPDLAPALRRAEALVEALSLARNQAKRARAISSRLRSGQASLAGAGAELHAGAERLANEAQPLPAGLDRLGQGASALAEGLRSLTGGADSLSRNLAVGHDESRPLQDGLARAGVRVSASATDLNGEVSSLRRSSPRIFDSGYFVLSALDGAPPAARRKAAQVVDLNGGQAAQLLVIPRSPFNTPGSTALDGRLRSDARELAARTDLRTGVTGGPAQLVDYANAVSSRVPLVIAAITLATFLVLVLVLRAVPLAAIAVLLNLLTVAVAFGILTLLFDVPSRWPLGGHDYVDSIGAAGIFGIVFGLSIDYAVFLLSRMREARLDGASNADAIAYGLQRTARVITGAAAIMLAVFVVFAAAPIATVSQLGTGLAVAVLLDATVVRIVLLPALMLLVGERVWWFPRFLDRALPKVGPHGA